jgi:hydroxymethylbilane synthase
VFVSALRDALLAGEIDVAVHSYKDLPTAPADGLRIAAVPAREDPRDVLVARDGLTLAELPAGARIGTGAVRRIAQLHALDRGFVPVPIRGNVDTRLGKVFSGELDAVVLALAGLARLGRADEASEIIDPELMLPAPAQGALAIECRADDPALVDQLSTVDDPGTRAAVDAERTLLATLEAGCSAPVAGLAQATGDGQIHLRGAVFSPDGRTVLRLARTGTLADAANLGRLLAQELLDAGADKVLGVQ